MLNLFEISELKKAVSENSDAEVHFHDTCGGQYFTVANASQQTLDLIWKYLKDKNQTAVFSEEEKAFTIK